MMSKGSSVVLILLVCQHVSFFESLLSPETPLGRYCSVRLEICVFEVACFAVAQTTSTFEAAVEAFLFARVLHCAVVVFDCKVFDNEQS